MSIIRTYILSLLLALCPLIAPCQQVEERLVVKDPGDSMYINAFRTTFDTSGNYYFETLLKGKGERFGMVTNKKKYSTAYWAKSIATVPYKAVLADAFFSDTSHKKIWYKNKSGTRIYGPHAGRVREVLEYGRDNVAIELCIGATSYLYINDSLVNVGDSLQQKWLCSFSDNGNFIYSVFEKDHYSLYLNYKRIDTSASPFAEIAVNNNGFYIYAKETKGKFFVHTPDKVYGPFGAVDGSDLWNNNAWYYRGCADSMCYVLVNGKLYDNIAESHSLLDDAANGTQEYRSDEQITVELADKDNALFSYNKNNEEGIFINLNGKVNKYNYTRTSFIFYNKGGYAFYGSRPDSFGIEHTYKNINGAEKKLPYFKKGNARAQCMQIDPDGSSLYYYTTADSIYLYRNDALLCPPAHRKKFYQWDASALPQAHASGTEFFQGFNVTDRAYIMYNNTLSRPMPLINPEYSRLDNYKKGNVVAGDINSNGFFIIVTTGPGKYLLNINNTIYKDLDGIDHIFGDQSYFTGNTLIFYGLKGTSFYEFKIRF